MNYLNHIMSNFHYFFQYLSIKFLRGHKRIPIRSHKIFWYLLDQNADVSFPTKESFRSWKRAVLAIKALVEEKYHLSMWQLKYFSLQVTLHHILDLQPFFLKIFLFIIHVTLLFKYHLLLLRIELILK